MVQANHGIGASGNINQLSISDELQVPAGGEPERWRALLLDQAQQFQHQLPVPAGAITLVSGPSAPTETGNSAIDRHDDEAHNAGDHLG